MSWQICQNFIRIFVNNMIFSFVLVTFYSLLLGMLLHKYWHNIFVYNTEWVRCYNIFYHLSTDNIKTEFSVIKIMKTSWTHSKTELVLNVSWVFITIFIYIRKRLAELWNFMSWQICQNVIWIFVYNMIFSFELVSFLFLVIGNASTQILA